jgi:hypothetical protein
MPAEVSTNRLQLTPEVHKELGRQFPSNGSFDYDILMYQLFPNLAGRQVYKSADPRAHATRRAVDGTEARRLAIAALDETAEALVPAKRLVVLPLRRFLGADGPSLSPELSFLSETHNLYVLRHILHARPSHNAQITDVTLRLDFSPSGKVFTWSMWPTTEFRTTVSAGVNVDVALNTKLKFEVPSVPLVPGAAVGGGVRAVIGGRFILVREWRRLHARIVASGKDDEYAEWSLRKSQELAGDVEFLALIHAPRELQRMQADSSGWYKIKPQWFRVGVKVDLRDRVLRAKLPSG